MSNHQIHIIQRAVTTALAAVEPCSLRYAAGPAKRSHSLDPGKRGRGVFLDKSIWKMNWLSPGARPGESVAK